MWQFDALQLKSRPPDAAPVVLRFNTNAHTKAKVVQPDLYNDLTADLDL